MDIVDVMSLPMVQVGDWSEMFVGNGIDTVWTLMEPVYTKNDVAGFAEKYFRDVSDQLEISRDVLVPILKKVNCAFYSRLDKLYKKYKWYAIDDPALIQLGQILMVPDLAWLRQDSGARVTNCWVKYCELTESKQAEIRARIGTSI